MWPFSRKKVPMIESRFIVMRGADGLYRWILMLNATIVAEGEKPFKKKKECMEVIGHIKRVAGAARIEYES